jgi:gluconolactonase
MTKIRYLVLLLVAFAVISGCKKSRSDEYREKLHNLEGAFIKSGSVERYDAFLDEIIPPGELPEIIAEGFEWTEGPVWLPEQKILLFSDIPRNTVFQWSQQGGIKPYLKPSGYTDTISRGGETGSNGLLLNNKR